MNNRLEITSYISIALNIMSVCTQNGLNTLMTAVVPKNCCCTVCLESMECIPQFTTRAILWMTLSNHLMLSDTEIFECSGVQLIFLGQTHYGIL